jgi:hypothetical protein
MLHRNFSLADGAILTFAAECSQTAEITARASVESSVNIAYIASGNAPERMQAYFHHYFSEVDRQVKTWSGGIEGLDQAEMERHRRAVKQRKDANDALRAAIGNAMGTSSERWPRTILPPAPPMFSTKNCRPSCSDSFCVIRRPNTSVGPPGA